MPCTRIPSLVLLEPFLTTAFSDLLQNYSPGDTTASSPNPVISSKVGVEIFETLTKGTGWETTRVGIGMVIWGMEMGDIGAQEAESGGLEVVDEVTSFENTTEIGTIVGSEG